MSSICEFCDDAKVWTTASDSPEEIRVLIFGSFQNSTVRKYDFGRQEIVGDMPILTREESGTPAHRESCDA